MLEGLDDIPWSDLRHAYGRADDVPRLLLDLLADEAAATEAMEQLWTNIWHQGSIYSATTAAVPFLIEVFGSPSPARAQVGDLLREIAEGGNVPVAQADAAREAVAAGVDTYLAALRDDGAPADVRVAAAFAVGGCRQHADRALAALVEAAGTEGDGKVLCSVLLAIDDLAGDDGPESVLDAFRDVATASPHQAARGIALIVLLRAGRPPSGLDVVGPLAAGIVEYHRLPWYDHGDYQLLDRAGDVGPDLRIEVVRALASSSVAEHRRWAIFLGSGTAETWRSPTPSIARVLAPLAVDDDEQVRRTALVTLMGFGDATALCADAFASAVERFPDDDLARIALTKVRDRRPRPSPLDLTDPFAHLALRAPDVSVAESLATWDKRRGRPAALVALVRRGREAMAALDVLRADVESPTRVVWPGQDVIERDEEWVRACHQAIEAITRAASPELG